MSGRYRGDVEAPAQAGRKRAPSAQTHPGRPGSCSRDLTTADSGAKELARYLVGVMESRSLAHVPSLGEFDERDGSAAVLPRGPADDDRASGLAQNVDPRC